MRPNLVFKTHIMRVPHNPGSSLLPRSPSSTSIENYHRIHHPRCRTNDAISSGAAVIILLTFKLTRWARAIPVGSALHLSASPDIFNPGTIL